MLSLEIEMLLMNGSKNKNCSRKSQKKNVYKVQDEVLPFFQKLKSIEILLKLKFKSIVWFISQDWQT